MGSQTRGRRTGRRWRLLAAAFVAAVLSLAPAPAPVGAAEGPEWQHALWIAAQLRADPSPSPAAVLLGGSCAREAIVDDAGWAADVERLGGGEVVTFNLSSRRQTFQQDTALVKALPEAPVIVFIGINAGRFTAPLTSITDTSPPASKPTWVRHHYRREKMWTPERKAERVEYWLRHRLPVFEERYDEHLGHLELLLATCVERGYEPVVLALPRNLDALGHVLDAPTTRYLDDGRRLAEAHGARFVDFVPDLGLTSDDFHDLDHLLNSGREVFQAWLAFETVQQLTADGSAVTADGSVAASDTGDVTAPPSQPPAVSGETPSEVGAGPEVVAGGAPVLGLAAAASVAFGVVLAALRGRAVRRAAVDRRSHQRPRRRDV
jgi:hypothetical protein